MSDKRLVPPTRGRKMTLSDTQREWITHSIVGAKEPLQQKHGGSWWATAAHVDEREQFMAAQKARQESAGWGASFRSRALQMEPHK